MNWRILPIAVGLALAAIPHARGQQAQPDCTQGTNDSWNLEWDGVSGRTYFLQWSENLIDWFYFPLIESGGGAPLNYGFTTDGPRFFLRLQFSDQVTSDPYVDDFDGDTLTNWEEVALYGSDPLAFNADAHLFLTDFDGDGLLYWEAVNIYRQNPDSFDFDGDGIPNSYEIAMGWDPTVANSESDYQAYLADSRESETTLQVFTEFE